MVTIALHPPSTCMSGAERFMIESGELQRLVVDLVVTNLQRDLDAQGIAATVRHEGHHTVHVRTYAAKHMGLDSHRAGLRLIQTVLAVDDHVRVSGVTTAKHGPYSETTIGIRLAGTDPWPEVAYA